MERKASLSRLSAILRVVICLPSTRKLFTFFKQRYSRSQIEELNSTCQCRGQRIIISERILFLRKCLDNSVLPRDIYEKVKKLRPRFSASIGRAFIKNDIVEEQDRLERVAGQLRGALRRVGRFLSFTDWIRFNKLLGETGYRQREKLRTENDAKLHWLRKQRFDSVELINDSVFNLSSVKLSSAQLEVLSRGPRFGIPPRSVCKEDILSEFEMFHNQVVSSMKLSTCPEERAAFKTKVASLAHDYANIKQDNRFFPLGKEHWKAIGELRSNKDIVITRPDKGAGVVLLDHVDYVAKMMDILSDTSKFECLGSCEDFDNTGQNERALQAFLKRQQKEGKLSESVYDRIRPTGSIRPRMYGLPKIHKPHPIPLRPILSMVGSAYHEMARWLTEVLQPVLRKFSSHVVKDSFTFAELIRDYDKLGADSFMCSFDVKSLFTNVPILETIDICLDTLYRSDDVEPPVIEEKLLKKLLLKCTCDVEFSFDNQMYRQIDGVAMGSPLGPVLANVFLGFCESRIAAGDWPELYRRYVDDTFSLFDGGETEALQFLARLNGLHPSLQFTMESEKEGKLPFLDVLVMRTLDRFTTTIYRKPTFTGLYTRWDSYCAQSRKIALIRSLASRARRICSPEYLDTEVQSLKSILQRNGYPVPILERVVADTLRKLPVHTVERKPLYIRLPWLGSVSSSFENRLQHLTQNIVPWCKPRCIFTSRDMFNTTKKDVLPADKLSNVIYLFNCECDYSYVGRTTQRLGERMRQHVPVDLVQSAKGTQEKRKRGRPRKNETRSSTSTDNDAPISTRTRSAGRAAVRSNTQGLVSSPVPSGAADDCVRVHAQDANSDTAITRHLKHSPDCLRAVCPSVAERFSILARGRSALHLATLEAIFIAERKPELCSQKQFIRSLSLPVVS